MTSSFRKNLLLLILIVVIALNLTVFIGAKLILSDSFLQLEQSSAKENIQRAINAVDNDLESLGTLCTDWSVWDDTYAFIADSNPEYLTSNLVDSTFTDLSLNAVLFFDASGNLIFGRAMNLETEEDIEVPADLLANLSRRQELWGPESATAELDGILLSSGVPILISSRPILTSEGEGPSRGALVMARWFTDSVISHLSERTALSLSFENVYGSQHDNSSPQSEQASVSVDPLNPEIIWGHYPLKGIDGQTVLKLSVKMNRDVYKQGEKTIVYFQESFFITSLLLGLVLYFIILKIRGRHEESERRFQHVFENTTDGLFVVEPGGKIILINKAAKQHLGIRTSISRWDSIRDLAENSDFCDLIKAGLAGQTQGPVDLTLFDQRLKKKQYLRSHAAPLMGTKDKQVGAIVTIHNVTGQKETDLLKSEFIATAAHELNTPLACIMGYSELLLAQPTFNESACKEYLPIIFEKSEALEKIIYDLLHLGKVESGGKIFLEKTTFDLHSSLELLLSSYRKTTPEHQFENNLPADKVIIVADRHRIDQVFDNILGNAVKYSPGGGLIQVQGERTDDEWVICVQDEGVGMQKDHIEHIFEKFYRIDSGPTAVSGLGLGLSITKNIIQEHGGRIWIESEPGQGTKVFFTLPC